MSGGQTAVVSGIGVVAPNGMGTEAFWKSTVEGNGGITEIGRFDASGYPVRVGGEILDFDPAEHLPKRLLPQTDRMTQYALATAEWALFDAGLDPKEVEEYRTGVITASACGGFEFGQRELEKLWAKGPEYVSAYQSYAWFYAVNTGQVSIRHGIRGHSSVLVTDRAGGLDAIAQGARLLEGDVLSVAVTGGLDASLCPWGLVAQMPNGRMSTVADPRRAYLPFDADASGYVAGEGGAMLVLESGQAASERGAVPPYGVIAGHAATFDPPPGSARPSTLDTAIRGALSRTEIDPEQIDVVFADAAGVPELDRAEADALAAVFGAGAVPVAAPKTMTGGLYSGGAALDVATALLSIRDHVVPPAIGIERPIAGLDLVRDEPREMRVDNALVVARGVGGFNSAMVVRR